MQGSDKHQVQGSAYSLWGIGERGRIRWGTRYALFLNLGGEYKRWLCYSLYTFCTFYILYCKTLKDRVAIKRLFGDTRLEGLPQGVDVSPLHI